MNSPVDFSVNSFIKINRRKADPLYLQLVYQFINAIKMNLLEEGDRLPGSRKIAKELQLHRKTVVAGLEELRAQGWITTKPGAGTFVKQAAVSSAQTEKHRWVQYPAVQAGFEFSRNFILNNPEETRQTQHYFTDGTADYRIIKPRELVRFYAAVLRRKQDAFTLSHLSGGNVFFRKQLSYYLNTTRGLHLSKDFLLPVNEREQVFSILSQLLIQTGDVVIVEELSYFLPNMIFSQAGAQLKTVPADAEGMDVAYLRQHFGKGDIRVVYLNTNSQYPTAGQLSEKRKIELLNLAAEYGFVIIEDGRDDEFSLKGNRPGTLFKTDRKGRVIYTGVFGGFLAPDFQMNFIAAPPDFIMEASKYLYLFGKPNPMMEQALGEMIHEGDIHRYRRKTQRITAERKEKFSELLSRYLGPEIHFKIPVYGLAFWVVFKKHVSLARLQAEAGRNDLSIPWVCLYQRQNLTALRLGFAHLHDQEMETAMQLLATAYQKVVSGK